MIFSLLGSLTTKYLAQEITKVAAKLAPFNLNSYIRVSQ